MHVSATWLIANLLHPLVALIVFGGNSDLNLDMVASVLGIIVYSLLFSLPSLLLSFLAIYGIFKLPSSITVKYITWLVIAPFIVFVNYWLLFSVFLGVSMQKEDTDFMLPAMIAVVLTILVRYISFFRMATNLNKKENETNMV
jgi:hypothetical protein